MSKSEFASASYTAGELNAIIKLLKKQGGEDGPEKFLRGELTLKLTERMFKTWKTVKLGTGLKTADDFRKALTNAGCNIGSWANDILGKPVFSVSSEETEVELVVVSVAELGFKNGATRKDIYKRAEELGFALCPSEVGPQLRLRYNDQPNGEWLLIGMEPIAVSDGDLRVFGVGRDDDGSQWLDGGCGSPVLVWSADLHWVFLRRK